MLPYDDLRAELCVSCARRNLHTPSLLVDPDHMHSCTLQEGVSVKRRHDAIKLALAELARSCGYHVEVEPRFPPRVEHRRCAETGAWQRTAIQQQQHGDLLLVRNGTRQLIDVTVVRPTSLTWLQHGATSAGAASGSHMQPLVAASAAEAKKLRTYSAECAHHGWTMVPFALESYGAKGKQAERLLQRMSAHSLDKSPEAFLAHAERVLSVALQVGNAGVAGQGSAELHLQAYRRSTRTDEHAPSAASSDKGGRKQRRTGAAAAIMLRRGELDVGALLHSEYRSARVGVAA